MRRVYLATLLSALLVFLIYGTIYSFGNKTKNVGVLKVGFIYENDEITPYTYNFSLGAKALEREYPGKVEVMTRSNVLDEETEEPLRELIHSANAF